MKKEELNLPEVLQELQKATKKYEFANKFHNKILVDLGLRKTEDIKSNNDFKDESSNAEEESEDDEDINVDDGREVEQESEVESEDAEENGYYENGSEDAEETKSNYEGKNKADDSGEISHKRLKLDLESESEISS